jgi:hypothetical protein
VSSIPRPEVAVPPVPTRRGVTLRAVALALLLTPLNVLFLVRGSWLWGGITGDMSLFMNTVGGLFVGALLNRWLRRRRPRWAFSAGELLTIYLTLAIGTGLTCSIWDIGGSAPIYMTHAFWFANPQNRWEHLVWPNLPTWLTVRDHDALEGLYYGQANPYTAQVLRAWAAPALWWTFLVATIMWVGLCVNSILRRRWADEEKLAFPITVLPVQLADDRYALFRSRLFWIGTGAAAGISIWNTLVALVPSLPGIPTGWSFATLIANNRPWNFLRFQSISWDPFSIGLTYLIPLDLAFSIFVFGSIWALQYPLFAQLGWCISSWSGFPYGEQQTAGGFIALAMVTLWLDRRFLSQVLRRAVGLRPSLPNEGEEGMSYRTATFGAVVGLAVLWWLFQRGGMAAWVTGIFLAHYFLMMIMMCRVRAQLGPPSHQFYGAMPGWVLPTVAGTGALGMRTMGMFYMLRPLLEEQRNHPMPIQLEALKMAEGGRMERRRLAALMAIVPVVALLAFFWATLHTGYHLGMASGHTNNFYTRIGGWATDELRTQAENPSGIDVGGSMAIVVSIVITSLLYYLKLQFAWWPLHPVAYPISTSNTIAGIAPALFLTWLIKSLLLRYGGLRAHRTALPLFLGFIVGDATVALVRELVFTIVGQRV